MVWPQYLKTNSCYSKSKLTDLASHIVSDRASADPQGLLHEESTVYFLHKGSERKGLLSGLALPWSSPKPPKLPGPWATPDTLSKTQDSNITFPCGSSTVPWLPTTCATCSWHWSTLVYLNPFVFSFWYILVFKALRQRSLSSFSSCTLDCQFKWPPCKVGWLYKVSLPGSTDCPKHTRVMAIKVACANTYQGQFNTHFPIF